MIFSSLGRERPGDNPIGQGLWLALEPSESCRLGIGNLLQKERSPAFQKS
jgi:hypothetical protein